VQIIFSVKREYYSLGSVQTSPAATYSVHFMLFSR